MPVVSAFMSTQMRLKAASLLITGSKYSPMVSAISSAVATYVVSASFVTSTNQVTGPGAGTFTGRLQGLSAPAMSKMMRLKATASLLTGRDIGKLFDSVSHGVVQALKTAMAQGAVVGGGPGSGTGKVLGLVPSALQGLIMAQMAAKGLTGSKASKLASAMAFGVCMHIMSAGMIRNTCIGAAAGPPAGPVMIPVAPGTGKLV